MTIRGIHNVSGVGCHLSCALLIVCHSLPLLREALIHLLECHQQSTTSNSSTLLALGKLLKEMVSQEDDAVDPSEFFSVFQSRCNAYDLGDATRALTVLFKTIRTVFCQGTKEEDALLIITSRQNFQALYEHLLGGTKEQVIRGEWCSDGKKVTRRKRKKAPLSAPFPIGGSKGSVEEAIQASLEPTPVKGYNWETATEYEESVEDSKEGDESNWSTAKQFAFL